MVVAADEQLHCFFTLAAGARFPPGATAGGFKFTHRHPFEIAGFGKQHHGTLVGDQIDVFKTSSDVENFGATLNRVAIAQLGELVLDDAEHPLTSAKDVFVVGDLGDQIFVLKANLVRLKSREPAQLHLQDRVSLNIAQSVTILELLSGRCRVGSSTDQGDDRIELIQGQQQAQEDVITLLGFAQ